MICSLYFLYISVILLKFLYGLFFDVIIINFFFVIFICGKIICDDDYVLVLLFIVYIINFCYYSL